VVALAVKDPLVWYHCDDRTQRKWREATMKHIPGLLMLVSIASEAAMGVVGG
jgi:hypothetical protein